MEGVSKNKKLDDSFSGEGSLPGFHSPLLAVCLHGLSQEVLVERKQGASSVDTLLK